MGTVAGLREVGETLLALHGQHDTERLLHRGNHLGFVDSFAKTEAEVEAYRSLYHTRCSLLEEIETLEKDDGEKLRRLDMLNFWIDEIEEAALSPSEDAMLEERREYLRHGEKIRLSAAKADEWLAANA